VKSRVESFVRSIPKAARLSALKLLLGSEIAVVTAFSLSAVGGLGWESGVALSADHLVASVLSSKGSK